MKIGVFDSGLGGLTVVKAMIDIIKGAQLFYIADTKNAPYGEKTREEILEFSLNITKYFIDTHQIDALIIACNTATSVAIATLREKYPNIIIIGTEPGVKPAIHQTATGKIGVLATPATLKGSKYQQLVNRLSREKNVILYEQACPGLVDKIEQGESNHPETVEMLRGWLQPMKDNGVDTIVLGCTHYPIISHIIKNLMYQDINLIQTGEAIAKHLLERSRDKGHLNRGVLDIQLYTTGTINFQSVKGLLEFEKDIIYIKI